MKGGRRDERASHNCLVLFVAFLDETESLDYNIVTDGQTYRTHGGLQMYTVCWAK